MSKSLTRKMFLTAVIVEALTIISMVLSHNLVLIASTLLLLAVTVQLIAWIGAIVKTVELKHWRWVLCLVFGGLIAMLVYVFSGPETQRVHVA
jgi:uncharacterized Tic20 family protein